MFLPSRGPDFRAAGRFIPNLYTMIATFLLTILALHDQHDLGSLPPMPDGPYLRPEKFGAPDLFRQMEYDLPTANTYRTASGAPGHLYWQNRADHIIHVKLNPEVHGVDGTEEITYHNESPDALRYLWMQLDQNRHAPASRGNLSRRGPDLDQPQSILMVSYIGVQSSDPSCDHSVDLKIAVLTDTQISALKAGNLVPSEFESSQSCYSASGGALDSYG